MIVDIQNLTGRPVVMCLNSGRSVHIGPRRAAAGITGTEVDANAKIRKLELRGIIAVNRAGRQEPAGGPQARKAKPESAGEKPKPQKDKAAS